MQTQKQQINLVTLKILWGALLASHFLYGFGISFLIRENTIQTETISPMLLPILSSMGIILFFGAIFIQRFFLQIAKKQLGIKFGAVDLSKLDIEDLISSFIAPFVVRLALFEAIAILGFILAFLNKDMKFFIPFATLSIVAYFFNFPSEEKIRNAFK